MNGDSPFFDCVLVIINGLGKSYASPFDTGKKRIGRLAVVPTLRHFAMGVVMN